MISAGLLRLCFFDESGAPLGSWPLVGADLAPAVERARWRAFKAGASTAEAFATTARISIRPLRDGSTVVESVLVDLEEGGVPVVTTSGLGVSFLTPAVERHVARLRAEGTVAVGELVRWCVRRVLDAPRGRLGREVGPVPRVHVRRAAPPLSIRSVDLGRLGGSRWVGPPRGVEDPVLFRTSALEHACRLASSSPELEVGGVLTGHLLRDGEGRAGVEVTGLVPAHGAETSSTHIHFSPDLWRRLARGVVCADDGQVVGWYHSHPLEHWLKASEDTPAEPPPRAGSHPRGPSGFLSADDVNVMRTCFSRAFSVALVLTLVPDAPTEPALFGWSEGVLQARGFYCTEGASR